MPGPSFIPNPARMAKDRDHDFPPRNWTDQDRAERRAFLRDAGGDRLPTEDQSK